MKPHHYAHHCLAVYKDSMYYFANLRAVDTVLHNLLWTCDVQEQFANTISSVLWLMQKFVWSVQRSSPTPIIGSLYQCRTAERQSWHTSVTLQILTGVYSLDFAVNRPYFTAVQHAPVFLCERCNLQSSAIVTVYCLDLSVVIVCDASVLWQNGCS